MIRLKFQTPRAVIGNKLPPVETANGYGKQFHRLKAKKLK